MCELCGGHIIEYSINGHDYYVGHTGQYTDRVTAAYMCTRVRVRHIIVWQRHTVYSWLIHSHTPVRDLLCVVNCC